MQYAKLAWELHHDQDRALSYFERAACAAPDDRWVILQVIIALDIAASCFLLQKVNVVLYRELAVRATYLLCWNDGMIFFTGLL